MFKKKIAALGLAMALAITALPVNAATVSAQEIDGIPNKISVDTTMHQDKAGDYMSIGYDYNTPVSRANNGMLKNAYAPAYRTVDELVNYYPDTRNQEPYGTCWAFSTVSLAEFDMVTKGYAAKDVYYSPLHLAYFTYHTVTDPLGGTAGDSNSMVCQPNVASYLEQGGNQYYAMRVLAGWMGVVNEADFPYAAAPSTVYGGVDPGLAYGHNAATLTNAQMVNIHSQMLAVKQGIVDHGAVAISYYADEYYYKDAEYNGQTVSTYYYDGLGGMEANHAVTVVGWDDNFPASAFVSSPSRNGAWLVRNSWTTTTGNSMSSYFWMSYQDAGIADAAYIFDFVPAGTYQNLYQYDGAFMVGGAPVQVQKAANVFTTKNSEYGEQIEAVQISVTNSTDVSYKIEVYKNVKHKDNPTSGKLVATKKGTTTYAGIYTVKLDNPIEVNPGEKYSIVLTQDNGQLDIEADFDMPARYGFGYKSEATASGNSFFNYAGTWICSNYFPDGGDFCIKAITNNSTTPHATSLESVENGSKGIKITWNKVAGAKKYKVQRSTNKKNWKTIKKVSKTSYTDTSVKNKNGKKFYYRVVVSGKKSGSKSIVRLTTPALSKASNSAKRTLTVSYKKNPKARGYQIQYSLKKNFKGTVKTVKVGGANNVKKVIKGLRKGKTYYVHVRCFNGKNYSGWSAIKKVRISK